MRIIKRKYVTLHVERHLSYWVIINLKNTKWQIPIIKTS